MSDDLMTYFVAQWLDTSGAWRESSGFGRDDENQQAHYSKEAGIEDTYSTSGAREFARILKDAGFTVRVIRRVENLTTFEI